jgi:hypothetical protein
MERRTGFHADTALFRPAQLQNDESFVTERFHAERLIGSGHDKTREFNNFRGSLALRECDGDLRSIAADVVRPFAGDLFVVSLADPSVFRESMLRDVIFAQNMRLTADHGCRAEDAPYRPAAGGAMCQHGVGEAFKALEAVAAQGTTRRLERDVFMNRHGSRMRAAGRRIKARPEVGRAWHDPVSSS